MAIECPQCQAEVSDDSRFCSKCGTPIHPSDKVFISQTRTILRPMEELLRGTELADKYKIEEVVGRGGMGIVYKAEDTKLKRSVALKFLPPELMRDEEAKERFVLEAQAAAALSHPNICTIHEIDEEEGKSFIAMEYVKGQSLKEKIERGPLGEQEALDIAIQVAEGLDEAYKKGIIHRDIKSANIMVTEKGQAKIRWARDRALPEIKRLIDSGETNYGKAYTLALKAEKYIPRHPELLEALSRCGRKISVKTEPPGARIFMKEYGAPESDWSYLGVSPVEDVRVPFGFFRWKFEKEGYEPALAVYSTFDWELDKPSLIGSAKIFKLLDKKGTVPPGMVRVT